MACITTAATRWRLRTALIGATAKYAVRKLGLIVSAFIVVGALTGPSIAHAESRDVEGCTDVLLYPAEHCTNPKGYHPQFIRTESWNSNGAGLGSCTGVSNENGSYVFADKCVGNLKAEGYDEVYCTEKCFDLEGYAWLANNSGDAYDYFTNWNEWV